MIVTADVYIDRGVLLVVAQNIQLLLLRQLTRIDRCRDSSISFAEHRKSGFVDVIVYQDYRASGLLDKADDIGVGVEDLAIVENAFDGRQRGADEEVDLFLQLVYLPIL